MGPPPIGAGVENVVNQSDQKSLGRDSSVFGLLKKSKSLPVALLFLLVLAATLIIWISMNYETLLPRDIDRTNDLDSSYSISSKPSEIDSVNDAKKENSPNIKFYCKTFIY